MNRSLMYFLYVSGIGLSLSALVKINRILIGMEEQQQVPSGAVPQCGAKRDFCLIMSYP